MLNNQILPFSQYVLRTPLFPLSSYWNVLENYSSETLLIELENPFIREAIRMASPELLSSLDKWKENPTSLSEEKRTSLEFTLLKYLSRISSRCTPFGLFAGCAVGNVASETNITLDSSQKYTRFTQFDMHFWVAMLQEFAKRKEVIDHLTYYPNNSIYAIGDFYRFVEYQYVKTRREHSISALRKSELLESLLLKAESGITVNEMVSFLADDDSEKEEALEFIYQLINFQFLTSELDATVSGSEEWNRVFSILNKVTTIEEEVGLLKNIQKEFTDLDKQIIPDEKTYQKIKELIHEMNLFYDEKFLFQTDLNIVTSVNHMNVHVSRKVVQALYFLNGIQKKRKPVNHSHFITAFAKRYDTREMPLVAVLDTEVGIGYLQNSEMNDTHSILEQFSFRSKAKEGSRSWTAFDFILEKKWQQCISKNEDVILLSEKDFPDFNSNGGQVPATFSVMIELIKKEEGEMICIDSSGDVSAAKLLGRFCNGNSDIYDLTKQIVEKEKEHHSDRILAEIVHIPESRTGNILRRPVLRDYEIVYLSNPGVAYDNQIALTDLMISVREDNIILRSKKHNKEVIPCLSNAHNYANNTLPIYHFLSDLQSQGVKPVYDFNWGILESHHDFFPRVMYKDVILSKAKWKVNKSERETFSKIKSAELFAVFSVWRKERKIPRFVNWLHFDNTLLFDFEKLICIQLFLKSTQNFTKITLEEFLFTEESVVKDENGENFTNQFILSFYKNTI